MDAGTFFTEGKDLAVARLVKQWDEKKGKIYEVLSIHTYLTYSKLGI